MATFTKFESFSEVLAEGGHNLDTNTLNVLLTNDAPSASLDAVRADLTSELATGNGYTLGGADIQNATSRTGGTTSVTAVDVTFTASGGSVGPFRYAVVFNDTHASDALVGFYDYGSAVTLADGESFTIDFGASLLTVA